MCYKCKRICQYPNPDPPKAENQIRFNFSVWSCPLNSKSEARNSKQILNSNATIPKQKLRWQLADILFIIPGNIDYTTREDKRRWL